MEKFTFTVGKLDAGMAILIGERAHLIEFPSILLPPGVSSGSIVNISVNRNQAAENAHLSEFWALQDQILNEYGIDLPVAPELKLRHVTQTSVTLEWPHIELAKADLRGLEIYKNGQRLALIPNPKSNTSTKLSSLQSNEEYTFQLVLKTTAGTFPSNVIKVRTHTMNDTSGISVCFGSVQDQNLLAHAKAALKQMKAKWTNNIEIDTTHFVCQAAGPAENNYNPTAEYLKAVQLSLPIVQPQWVLACQIEKKLVPVSAFQLGADTPHKYQPQGNLVQEAEQESKLQTAEPKTEKASALSSPEETARNADTVNQDGAHASVQSPDAGPSIDPGAPLQQSIAAQNDLVNHPQQIGNSSPPAAPRSPKPEADGKLDRSFKFPVSSPPADDESHTAGTEATSNSEFTASGNDKATEGISASLTKEDKAMETQPLVEEPRTIDHDAALSSQVTEDPVSASAKEESQAESTMDNPRRPEPKKTETDVDVAARQWLSGQKPVDAADEHDDHSMRVLDEVLIKKAAAQAEKEAAVAAPVSTQPVETEEIVQEPPAEANPTPEVEVQKDRGEVVKVARESTSPENSAQSEAAPNVAPEYPLQTETMPDAKEPVEDEGEVQETNEDEDQTPADSVAPTPSESPAPAEGETPVTGGSKKKKNKKKNKK